MEEDRTIQTVLEDRNRGAVTMGAPKTTDLVYPKDFINKIICGNCVELMQKMPEGEVT